MKYLEAGKFLKKKRKLCGFVTQKSFIQALKKIDPEINCSESYISLIEAGVKSPSVSLLDIMSTVLKLSQQEKGELLLIYKRVPNDLEFTVRTNLKDSIKTTNIDTLRKKYNETKNTENFNKLVRALVLEERADEALELLKSAPEISSNFIDYQSKTAQIAAISGNYDFAIQAFKLALANCTDEYIQTKSDLLMNIGISYFNKGLLIQSKDKIGFLELLLESKNYLEKSLNILSENIYCLDEYAKCTYYIGDTLKHLHRKSFSKKLDNETHANLLNLLKEKKIELKNNEILFSNNKISEIAKEIFQTSLKTYKQVLSHTEKGDLPEKILKENVYFYAYVHTKLEIFDEALLLINSVSILDQNWLTYFLKAGYYIGIYEKEKNKKYLDIAIDNLKTSLEYDPDTVKQLIKDEKEWELETLWKFKSNEINELLQEGKDV